MKNRISTHVTTPYVCTPEAHHVLSDPSPLLPH